MVTPATPFDSPPIPEDMLPEEGELDSNRFPTSITTGVAWDLPAGVEELDDGQRMGTVGTHADIFKFFQLLKAAIDANILMEGLQWEPLVRYGWPEDESEITAESILFEEREEWPGLMEKGGMPRGGEERRRMQHSAIMLEVADDAENVGQKKIIYNSTFDSIVCVTACARTDIECLKRAKWLRRAIQRCNWYFRRNGVGNVIYGGQQRPTKQNVIRNNRYVARELTYYVRIQENIAARQKTLERIFTTIGVAPFPQGSE